jgi:alkylated DNA repair dioxygenase AlkB
MSNFNLVTKFESNGAKLKAGTLNAHGGKLLEAAVDEVQEKLEAYPPIELYGKVLRQRRHIGFFANPQETVGYFYSRSVARSIMPGVAMTSLLDYVNELFGSEFNGVLVNYYPTGDDYISDHSDSEAGLDCKAGVVILSYGATRTMHFKKRKDAPGGCCKHYELKLTNNSVVVMGGPNFQKSYTHGIPKQANVKEARFSFTFRVHSGKGEVHMLAQAEKTLARIHEKLEASGESECAPAAKRVKVEKK